MDNEQGAFDEHLPNDHAKDNECTITHPLRRAVISTHAVHNVVFIVAALLMTGVLPAAAGEPNTLNSSSGERTTTLPGQVPQNVKPRYPFTADELWEKMLKVVAMPDGHVTSEQVEQIFGMKLKLMEKANELDRSKMYVVRREIDWYFDMSLFEEARESRFYFGWGFPPGVIRGGFAPPPPGMCIDESKVMSAIAALGWKPAGQVRDSRGLPDFNRYRKGKMGVIEVGFTRPEKCLLYITISAKNNLTD